MIRINDQLTASDRRRSAEIAHKMDVSTSAAISRFCSQIQNDISRVSDLALDHMRTKDDWGANGIITELVQTIRGMDINSLTAKRNRLNDIPLIGPLFNSAKQDLVQYRHADSRIDNIAVRLDRARMQLIRDNAIIASLINRNAELLRELTLNIAAGQLKLSELGKMYIQQSVAEDSPDSDLLEEKINDLLLSRMIAFQTGSQLQLICHNNQLLIDKLQSALVNTIPLWKNQFAIAMDLLRQKEKPEEERPNWPH